MRDERQGVNSKIASVMIVAMLIVGFIVFTSPRVRQGMTDFIGEAARTLGIGGSNSSGGGGLPHDIPKPQGGTPVPSPFIHKGNGLNEIYPNLISTTDMVYLTDNGSYQTIGIYHTTNKTTTEVYGCGYPTIIGIVSACENVIAYSVKLPIGSEDPSSYPHFDVLEVGNYKLVAVWVEMGSIDVVKASETCVVAFGNDMMTYYELNTGYSMQMPLNDYEHVNEVAISSINVAYTWTNTSNGAFQTTVFADINVDNGTWDRIDIASQLHFRHISMSGLSIVADAGGKVYRIEPQMGSSIIYYIADGSWPAIYGSWITYVTYDGTNSTLMLYEGVSTSAFDLYSEIANWHISNETRPTVCGNVCAMALLESGRVDIHDILVEKEG